MYILSQLIAVYFPPDLLTSSFPYCQQHIISPLRHMCIASYVHGGTDLFNFLEMNL